MTQISIKINNMPLRAEAGQSILQAALDHNISIPTLCFHPDVPPRNHCGLCLVKVKGKQELHHACSTPIEEGMEIETHTEEIAQKRKENLDTILQKHTPLCAECVWFQNCALLTHVRTMQGKLSPTKNPHDHILQSGPIIFDQHKCMGCSNCVQVCPVQFLAIQNNKVTPSPSTSYECIHCGQCILHCPVGAIKSAGEFRESTALLETMINNPEKTVVVQFAPSIRSSIGEAFGLEPGSVVTEQMVSGLKQLGFDYVFDTAAGADFTTMEESNEIMEKISENKDLPAMSSCCPAWVKFVEFYYPEFIPHLCTSRSPQAMLGGIVKTYWSKKKQIDPKNIFMVSIMPCTAKKFEIQRDQLKIGDTGIYPVDLVLTTRELARLFKKNTIDLKNIEKTPADDPLGVPSGAGVIYGSSGGVFESALRTVYFKLTQEEMPEHAVSEIRGLEGIKKKNITIGEKTLKVCVVSGVKNAIQILEELKTNPTAYDAVEVMACPGGCINGGGQPVPVNQDIVEKRSAGLYSVDTASELKVAHKNENVQAIYAEFFSSKEKRKEVLHTHFEPREKSTIITN